MQNVTLERTVTTLVTGNEAGSTAAVFETLEKSGHSPSKRHVLRILDNIFGQEPVTDLATIHEANGKPLNSLVVGLLNDTLSNARTIKTLVVTTVQVEEAVVVVANDRRGQRWWVRRLDNGTETASSWLSRLRNLVGKDIAAIPHGPIQKDLVGLPIIDGVTIVDWAHPPLPYDPPVAPGHKHPNPQHSHLDALEAESIRIIREAVALSQNPAMLFSMGKDSMVMLTLAKKAFWPEPIPFPLVMIDTRWKFQEMYQFRHWIEAQPDLNVIVHINPDAIRDDINPFDHGSAHHTDVTKTQALKQVLDTHRFDYVFGGARRDEEKSRAKERVFSVRGANHGWDPKNQRPELWNMYNTRLADGESMRVFPLSNWTELDVWRYIERENIPVVPLYFSKVRPFVERNGSLIMVDDDRFRLEPEEKIHFEPIRFRTLGCYPLTGGVRSEAKTVADIIAELEESRVSERSSRVIDFDPGASMEQKKKEGYF